MCGTPKIFSNTAAKYDYYKYIYLFYYYLL